MKALRGKSQIPDSPGLEQAGNGRGQGNQDGPWRRHRRGPRPEVSAGRWCKRPDADMEDYSLRVVVPPILGLRISVIYIKIDRLFIYLDKVRRHGLLCD